MLSINSNFGASLARFNASTAQAEQATAQARLSSGVRINSAADDAAGKAVMGKLRQSVEGVNTGVRNAALSYASKGWHIFPVTPNKKIPYGPLVPRGHLNATTSADQIIEWWTDAPNANIGLNLEASGLVCIDVDSYKPDCGFDDFIRDKHLPQTPQALQLNRPRTLLTLLHRLCYR